MKKEEITHKGRIVEITPEFTTVEIVSESACSACHAKGLCGVSESKTKAVQLPTRGWDNWQVGDEVSVCLKASMGHKAVWIAYVIPLVVLVSVLLALAPKGELLAGLCAIGAVALYYLLIFLMRGKLRDQYVFSIRK